MHGLNGMKSSVYFSCCTVIKKYGAHASTAAAALETKCTQHFLARNTRIYPLRALGDGRWMSLAPDAKKMRCDLDCGVYVSQERAHTLTEATKGGELLRPSGCK